MGMLAESIIFKWASDERTTLLAEFSNEFDIQCCNTFSHKMFELLNCVLTHIIFFESVVLYNIYFLKASSYYVYRLAVGTSDCVSCGFSGFRFHSMFFFVQLTLFLIVSA